MRQLGCTKSTFMYDLLLTKPTPAPAGQVFSGSLNDEERAAAGSGGCSLLIIQRSTKNLPRGRWRWFRQQEVVHEGTLGASELSHVFGDLPATRASGN